MNGRLRIALLIDASRGYRRNLLRGIAAYARIHGPWSGCHHELALGRTLPPQFGNWQGDGVIVRTDNPRLLGRSRARRDERTARGLPSSPMKITVSESVDLDAHSNFFTAGETEKLIYTSSGRVTDARARLGPVATIVDGGPRVRMRRLSEDRADRGVGRLMVEGGGVVHTQFLADDLVDELQLVVAPFFVGDSSAPRFVRDGRFPWNAGRRASLAQVRQLGDVVLLRYALSSRFEDE